jgi:hypothetical protein
VCDGSGTKALSSSNLPVRDILRGELFTYPAAENTAYKELYAVFELVQTICEIKTN